jgi:hypothetical protein
MIVVRAVTDASIPGLVRASVRRYDAGVDTANAPPTDNVENVGARDAVSLVGRWLEELAAGAHPLCQ